MNVELILLRLVHVLGGMFWVGTGLFSAFFLMPTLAASGATMGTVMAGLQRRRLYTVLPIVAILTIGSGMRLMYLASAGLDATYFASTSGRAFATAGASATLAWLVSAVVVRPSMQRATLLAATLADADEAERAALERQAAALRRRGQLGSTVALVLLVIGAAGMAIARYLP